MRKTLVLVWTMLLAVPATGQSDQASSPSTSVCTPHPGEGARWLGPCKQAADAGDGHAALMVGIIYWNGDGVPRDHPAAAHWFQIADKGGEPRAAKFLGDEAFVRVTQTATGKPEDADRAILDEAIGWYEKAVKIDPDSTARAQAQRRLDLLSNFRHALQTHHE